MISTNPIQEQIAVCIIGATGYTGVELVRILSGHPQVKINYLVSESYQNQEVINVFPHLAKTSINISFSKLDVEIIADNSDVVFLALPHTASAILAGKFLSLGVRVIDLSADLRLKDGVIYEKWYQHTPAANEMLHQAVYGLPEIGKNKQIQTSNLIANPGCYPTASILAIAPLITNNVFDINSTLILDAKSGVSGSGRSLNLASSYCEVTSSFAAYQIAGIHRHIPEIEQELSTLAKQKLTVCFTPHLIPMPRGLMITAYCKLNQSVQLTDIEDMYKQYYRNSYFVRVGANKLRPTTKSVVGSNFCDISLYFDERTGHLIVISVIDNLIKGASGQAVQNMNLMYGFAEQTGLEQSPLYP